MFGALGLFSVVIGAAAAYAAPRFPAQIKALETIGGLLLIAGFALASRALPICL